MKKGIHVLFYTLLIVLSVSCKKNTNDYYEYGTPSFTVTQVAGEPETWYGKCTSHDIIMDSVHVTSPLNIRSRHYFQGQSYSMDQSFLIGDTFIVHNGKWAFIFYGRKSINKLSFIVYIEKEI